MNWQPIATAPRDGTMILILAKWDWHKMGRPSELHSPRVCSYREWEWEEMCWMTETENPYVDHAVDILGWSDIPEYSVPPVFPEVPETRHSWRQGSKTPICGDVTARRPSDYEFQYSNSTAPICKDCEFLLKRGTTTETRQGVARAKDETL